YADGAHYVAENDRSLTKRAPLKWHNHKQVNIRIRTRFPVGMRTEEHNLLGMKLVRDCTAQELDPFPLPASFKFPTRRDALIHLGTLLARVLTHQELLIDLR